MKRVYFILLISLISINSLYAVQKESLPELINQMKKADAKERYIYMNKIKIKLRELNLQERNKILQELKKNFNKHQDSDAKISHQKMQNQLKNMKPYHHSPKGHKHNAKH